MSHKQVVLLAILTTLLFYGVVAVCLGSELTDQITDQQAIHCILGEARGEGYDSLLAHAEALRTRAENSPEHPTNGVYGCRAVFTKEIPYLKAKGILAMAEKAWEASCHTNTVFGSDHWGSLIIDKTWIAKMEKAGYKRTVVINNTAFYRKD